MQIIEFRSIIKEKLKEVYRFRFKVIILCTLQIIISLLPPYFFGKLLDKLSVGGSEFFLFSFILFIIISLDFLLNWFQNYLWFKMNFWSEKEVRNLVFDVLMEQTPEFWSMNSKGSLQSKIMTDAANYAQSHIILFPILFTNLLRLCGITIIMLNMNIILTILIVVMCIIYWFAYRKMNISLKTASQKTKNNYSKLTEIVSENLDGIQTIHMFQAEKFFSNRFRLRTKEYFKTQLGLQYFKSLAQSAVGFLLDLMPLIVLVVGGILVGKRFITIGTIVSFYAYLSSLSEPISNLTDYNIMVQEIHVLENRLAELFPEYNQYIERLESKKSIQEVKDKKIKSFCCDKIGFSYEKEKPLFTNLSFELYSGDRLAITGKSGCGKSTLLRLLLNEICPLEGKILINGEPLDSIPQAEYLTKIAVVPQDIFLFDGTVFENMTLGVNYSDKKLNFIKTLSGITKYSLDMKVTGFSGGERQRLAIARALLRDADIIIMDEPTSALDTTLSEEIVENLNDYLNKNTAILIVVSHRSEIIKICNKTIKLT